MLPVMSLHHGGPSFTAPRLLHDEPASHDAFGPHGIIAAKLAELVNNEPRGLSISLRGAFGSGKSTVIRLLSKSLVGDSRTFVFDAWAHSGDSLRRTFLEKLILYLSEEPAWIDKDEWNKVTLQLNGRQKRELKRSTPYLTPMGFAVVLSLALVPVGSALRTVLEGYWQIPAFLLVAAPLLLGTATFSLNLLSRPKERDGEALTKRERVREAASLAVTLLTNQSTTDIVSETSSTPEPTSIEFESCYRNLIGDALGQLSSRRLVIVIDNLDRLDAHESQIIWSTLSTFTGTRYDNIEGFQRVWLVVPIASETSIPGSSGSDYAQLLEKVFQVTVVVPRALLSKWKSFFDDRMAIALPSLTDQERHGVYRIFAAIRAKSQPPTPREITVFLNELNFLHSIRAGEISIEATALFTAMGQQDGIEPGALSNHASMVPEGLRDIVPANEMEALAALYFGVPLSDASQVLFGSRIESYIQGGDVPIGDLAEHPSFWLEFENTVGKALEADENETAVLRALAFLAAYPQATDQQSGRRAMSRVVDQALHRPHWTQLNEDTAGSLLFAANASPRDDALMAVVAAVFASMSPEIPGVDNDARSLADYAAALKVMLDTPTVELELALRAEPLHCSARRYIHLIRLLRKQGVSMVQLALIRPYATSPEIADALAAEMTFPDPASDLGELVDCFVGVLQGEDWENIASVIADQLKEPPYAFGRSATLWRVLDRLERLDPNPVGEKATNLVKDGFALRTYLDAVAANDGGSAGLLLFEIIWWEPDIALHAGLPDRHSDTIDIYPPLLAADDLSVRTLGSALSFASEWESLPTFLKSVADSASASVLLGAFLKQVCSDPQLLLQISAEQVISKPFLDTIDDSSMVNVAAGLLGTGLGKALEENSLDNDSWRVYAAVVRVDEGRLVSESARSERKAILLAVNNLLQETGADRWHDEILQGGPIVSFLEDVREVGHSLRVDGHLAIELSNFALAALDGGLTSQQGERIQATLACLSVEGKKIIGRNCLDSLMESSQHELEVATAFADTLTADVLAEQADGIVRQIVAPAVSGSNVARLRLALWLLAVNPELIARSKPASRKVLQGILDSDPASIPEPARDLVDSVRQYAASRPRKSPGRRRRDS
jgi:hypothetical protein